MSLPSPNLDTRKFQEIVDDVKRQIGLRCPEWTDHNVSDPGVTLLELFAYMTEMALFRLNQVPEKNYIKYLEMIGIELEPPESARTQLRFLLSTGITDDARNDNVVIALPKGKTVAGTLRTETESSIEFATDEDLKMVRPRLEHVYSVPGRNGLASEEIQLGKSLKPGKSSEFKLFSDHPGAGDAMYLGFEGEIAGNLIEIDFDCVTAAATGLNEDYPAQKWEVWSSGDASWVPLEVTSDTTFGFNRTGSVILAVPGDTEPKSLSGHRAIWVRVRYTVSPDDLPPRGVEQLRPDPYEATPVITGFAAQTIGGTVPASHARVVHMEVLGQSDGLPGQVFRLREEPVLKLAPEETLLVGPDGIPTDEWAEWSPVEDFSNAGPEDKVFHLDALTGEVFFGPVILQPDGSSRQYGAVPEKGMNIVFRRYRVGGGALGNVREHTVRIMKSGVEYIADVTNPVRASGGRDREELARAKMRAREILRIRNRAVTAEDYEFLAEKASSGVGRAVCIQPTVHPSAARRPVVRPGIVRVALVPQMPPDLIAPAPRDLKVSDAIVDEVYKFLDERRLLTAMLDVGEPDYVFVGTEIRLVADPRADAEMVARRVEEALYRYIHPLFGGPTGKGWPTRRTLTLADIYAQVGSVRGVAFLLDAQIKTSTLKNAEEGVLGTETVISNAEGVGLGEGQLFASRNHVIKVVPMSAVGAGEEAL